MAYGLLVEDINSSIGYMLAGCFLSGEFPRNDTDALLYEFKKVCTSDVTHGALEEFQAILEGLGYKFYSPYEDHDAQFIFKPGEDYETERKACLKVLHEEFGTLHRKGDNRTVKEDSGLPKPEEN